MTNQWEEVERNEFQWIRWTESSPSPTPGDIVTAFSPWSDEYLLSLVVGFKDDDALLAPVSAESRFAADWDVLLDSQVLGYSAFTEIWNTRIVLREQIREKLGSVGSPQPFFAAYDQMICGGSIPSGLEEGPAILTPNDPRNSFRAVETTRATQYAEPAETLATGSSLGAIVNYSREKHSIEFEKASEETEIPVRTIERIERDAEDLQSNVPVKFFAKLLNLLEIPPAQKLIGLVEDAVFSNYAGEQVSAAPRLARRRSGQPVPQSKPIDEASRQQAAKSWAETLREEMVTDR